MIYVVRVAHVFVLLVSLLVVAIPGSALAVQPDEVLADGALEKRARALSAGLRCVVCQNQSIDDSDAPLAGDLRRLVRERLVAGDSDEEVISAVVARYGEYVLLKPRFGLHTAILWLLPFAVLGIAIAMLLRRRGRTPVGQTDASAQSTTLTVPEEDALARLMDDEPGTAVSKE